MDNTTAQTHIPGFLGYLMSSKCFDSLFIEFNLFDGPCLLMVFSKLLSYAIILVTSLFMKLPQIWKILEARSADGVSLSSQGLMLVTASSGVLYAVARDYHISLWGESISLALQTLVIVLLILHYEGRAMAAIGFTIAYVIVMVVMLSPFVPLYVHVTMQTLALPLGCLSKLIQIITNYRHGGTGQLSSLYIFLTNFRSLGRFTTMLLETKDYLRICDFGIKSFLNIVQLLQILYYQRKTRREVNEKNNNKEKKVTQICSTYGLGHLGQLCTISTLSMVFRSIGRLFTAYRDTGDLPLILEFSVHCMLNAILVGQILYYRRSTLSGELNFKSHHD